MIKANIKNQNLICKYKYKLAPAIDIAIANDRQEEEI